jgi:hypothetical protein
VSSVQEKAVQTFAPPALPGFIATMGGSDFQPAPSASSLFTLVRGYALPCAPMTGSPWLPHVLNVRLDTASDPGEHPSVSPCRPLGCCLLVGQAHRHSPNDFFGAPHLQGRHHPLPLHLACFRAYASTGPLPRRLQGSIPGSWLAITRAGFSPARMCGIAKPLLARILSASEQSCAPTPQAPSTNIPQESAGFCR